MEASQQQILATKKRVIRKRSEHEDGAVKMSQTAISENNHCVKCNSGHKILCDICSHDINKRPRHGRNGRLLFPEHTPKFVPHECLKCNKVGDWTEVYYEEYLCGVCIHGKCLYCQRGIYGKTHGEELCEPCFDKYKVWNMKQHGEK
jgi:hypothetical protein